ncbi:MAG: hypothetical protein IPI68_11630 [Chitinophagaceae bacterium]|nr:hypothetical protein [Chitinophagaceae bacterium]
MKKLLYIFISFFISFAALAQDDEDTFSPSKLESIAKNMKTIWEDGDADFTVIATPDKWKEESGVILAQKQNLLLIKTPINWRCMRSHVAASN